MKKLLIICLISCAFKLSAQYKYGLKPVGMDEYKETIVDHPEMELVDLEKFIPNLQLDIRYATTNNFTGEVIYNLPMAFARRPVAEALLKVQNDLKKKGLELKIHDAYRPYYEYSTHSQL